jgi:hypothetical protein
MRLRGLVGVLALAAVFVAGCGRGAANPRGAPPLPRGFATFAAMSGPLRRAMRAHTHVPVWIPLHEASGVTAGRGPRLDATYRATADSYRLTLYEGPPLKVNAPAVSRLGMGRMVVRLAGATTVASLPLTQWFGNLSPIPTGAGQGEVGITATITATNFTGRAGNAAATGVEWQESGWTFIITPAPHSAAVDSLAAQLARRFRSTRLPSTTVASPMAVAGAPIAPTHGLLVFRLAAHDPSLALFRRGGAWYAVWATNWDAPAWAQALRSTHPA